MKNIFVLISLLFTLSLYSQTDARLIGHIKNGEDSTNIAGVTVTLLKESNIVAKTGTDSNGNFIIDNIPTGTYQLTFRYIGQREKIISDLNIVTGENKKYFIYPDPCKKSIKECPQGHKDNIIPIVYGLAGKKLMKMAKKGEVKLGGCMVYGCDPIWYCKIHKIDF